MDNFEKIEKLVNKAGCSYEDAKAALEGSNWDMIDAIISLERDGKVAKPASEQTAQKADDGVEIVTEVKTDRGNGNSGGSSSYSGNKGDDGRTGSTQEKTKKKLGLWTRFKGIMTNNRMVILKSNGQQIVDLPIWIPVIALITFFWATLILAAVAMVFGCRFHFEGADLGKININNTMDKATDYAEKVRNDLTGRANDKQNSDN